MIKAIHENSPSLFRGYNSRYSMPDIIIRFKMFIHHFFSNHLFTSSQQYGQWQHRSSAFPLPAARGEVSEKERSRGYQVLRLLPTCEARRTSLWRVHQCLLTCSFHLSCHKKFCLHACYTPEIVACKYSRTQACKSKPLCESKG